MADPVVQVMWEDWADRSLPLPQYETAGAAGADLRANLRPEDRATGFTLDPMRRAVIPTGIRVAIPMGYEMQIRPRSGLALKHGISLPNTPGTIDSDYRGEVKVILANLGEDDFMINKGDRIAQILVAPVTHGNLIEVEDLDETVRGTGGFGSTGV